jgi:hypothetical protein
VEQGFALLLRNSGRGILQYRLEEYPGLAEGESLKAELNTKTAP